MDIFSDSNSLMSRKHYYSVWTVLRDQLVLAISYILYIVHLYYAPPPLFISFSYSAEGVEGKGVTGGLRVRQVEREEDERVKREEEEKGGRRHNEPKPCG